MAFLLCFRDISNIFHDGNIDISGSCAHASACPHPQASPHIPGLPAAFHIAFWCCRTSRAVFSGAVTSFCVEIRCRCNTAIFMKHLGKIAGVRKPNGLGDFSQIHKFIIYLWRAGVYCPLPILRVVMLRYRAS